MRTVSESLAGRAGYLELLPLSWSEVTRAPRPDTIRQAFAAGDAAEFLQALPAAARGGKCRSALRWQPTERAQHADRRLLVALPQRVVAHQPPSQVAVGAG